VTRPADGSARTDGPGGRRSLRDIEAMYGSLVDLLPAIVYVAEPRPQYATIYISRSITLLGYTHEEWLGDPYAWVKILHPDDRDWVLDKSQQCLHDQRDSDFEYRVLARDGGTRWIHDRGRFVFGPSNTPICWQGIMLDVTPRKEAEAERERLLSQLQSARDDLKELGELVPICAYCKRVRDDRNYWQGLDRYVAERTSSRFTHGICPDCYTKVLEAEGSPDEPLA